MRHQGADDRAGDAYEHSFVLADVRMSWPLRSDEVMLFVSPEGLVVVAPLPDGHYRLVATVDDAPEHPKRKNGAAALAGESDEWLDPAGDHRGAIADVAAQSRINAA
ncbi:MAG: hypothetical protein E6J65_27345 [Deltaproteobacteria bacterium]|nr:MAG: hypothetical protein E6J65_27345 [Deltaproteobacteria bacterium]